MTYKLYACLERTRGQDNEVTLTLCVDRPEPPRYLSDFLDGNGHISNGYSGAELKFQIEICTFDERRLELRFANGGQKILHPAFKRTHGGDFVRPLDVMQLAYGQYLSLSTSEFASDKYVVTHSNWWEPIHRPRR